MRLLLLVTALIVACGESGPDEEDVTGRWHATIDGVFGQLPEGPPISCTVEFDFEMRGSPPDDLFTEFPLSVNQTCDNGFDGTWDLSGSSYLVHQDGLTLTFLDTSRLDTFVVAAFVGSRIRGTVISRYLDAEFRAIR